MDGNYSSLGAAGLRRWSEGQLSLRAGSTSPSQSAITQCGCGFHTRRDAGRYRPGIYRLSPQVVEVVDVLSDSQSGDGALSSLGGAGFILKPEPISDLSAGLWFPLRAGRFRPGKSPLSSPGCRSCRCTEGFLNRGWGSILPGCSEIVGVCSRGNSRRARLAPS